MIRLSGQEVDRDIPIEIVGPRAGEKLREELFNEWERPVPTEADRIMKAERVPLDADWVESVIERIERLVEQGDETYLAQQVAELTRKVHASPAKDLSALAK
jgi:FlaA1/EpsC-like NDP-sugar epimerase